MAKFVDLEGLATFLTKMKEWTNSAINSAKSALQTNIDKKADKTTTVNGHALSGNVTVSKADVGLGNVTNDAQVKRSEMGARGGVAKLGGDGKVPTEQLPTLKTVNGTSIVGSGNISIDLTLYKVVTQLPTTGIDANKIYLVLSASSGTQNTYTEYIYVNSKWEKLGEYKAEVDLTDYVKFTDTATTSKAGLMSKEDKKHLDNWFDCHASGGQNGVVTNRDINFTQDANGVDLNYSYSVDNDDEGVENGSNTIRIQSATSTAAGVMSASDKKKLDGIDTGATADSAVTTTEIEGLFS